MPCFRVIARASHTRMLARCTDPFIECIMLDIVMKQSNGVDVCRRLRRDGVTLPIVAVTGACPPWRSSRAVLAAGRRSRTPRLCCVTTRSPATASVGPADLARYKTCGFTGLLKKPFTREELHSKLRDCRRGHTELWGDGD